MFEDRSTSLEERRESPPITRKNVTSHYPTVIAGFSSWLLDAFDFFLITFCLTAIARDFHKSDVQIAVAITMTLVFRPVGGFFFGLMADKYGRRLPLMCNIGAFALAEVLTGLAPNYTMLLIVRAFFGLVMGGNWGVAASLAIDDAPVKRRGVLSGLFQEGYAAGNVVAGICYFFFFGHFGWRPLFFLGSLPALALILFIRFRVRESTVWQKKSAQKLSWSEILCHWKLFLYLLLFVSLMMFASHGTQDMYPTFLQRQWHFTPERRSMVTIISRIGAIIGGIAFGHFSDHWGRRRAIIAAFVLGIVIIPVWAYPSNQAVLIAGAFLMQFMVQGAWGVVPAHLAELSPDSVRALLPGFAYQSAGVIASTVVYIEAVFAHRTSYATAMAFTAFTVFLLASIMTLLGRERHGHTFGL